ncbi:MAG: hypothetical protein HQ559_06810, partial [Lentisphaerae bacterium]|nr:hypothetical protein [Lentisphaerota bacterium]
MKVSRRESALVLVTLTVGLLGGTAMLARPRLDRLKQIRAEQESVKGEIRRDRELVSERKKWIGELDELSKALPLYPPDKKMDVYWLAYMDKAAAKHGVRIKRRKAGKEKSEGDFYELPIEVEHDGWEGNLESLVRFLFDLHSQGAMLDIRQLLIKPRKDGVLEGRFSLY